MSQILREFDINSLYICPPHLYTVAILPREIQKVIFQQYYPYILQIIYVKFSQDLTHQKSLKSVNFWQSYLKNKKVDVFWDTV